MSWTIKRRDVTTDRDSAVSTEVFIYFVHWGEGPRETEQWI